nr:hypothetical protein [Abalone asfa-like virus]
MDSILENLYQIWEMVDLVQNINQAKIFRPRKSVLTRNLVTKEDNIFKKYPVPNQTPPEYYISRRERDKFGIDYTSSQIISTLKENLRLPEGYSVGHLLRCGFWDTLQEIEMDVKEKIYKKITEFLTCRKVLLQTYVRHNEQIDEFNEFISSTMIVNMDLHKIRKFIALLEKYGPGKPYIKPRSHKSLTIDTQIEKVKKAINELDFLMPLTQLRFIRVKSPDLYQKKWDSLENDQEIQQQLLSMKPVNSDTYFDQLSASLINMRSVFAEINEVYQDVAAATELLRNRSSFDKLYPPIKYELVIPNYIKIGNRYGKIFTEAYLRPLPKIPKKMVTSL